MIAILYTGCSAWAGRACAGSAWTGSAWTGSAWADGAWAGSAWAGAYSFCDLGAGDVDWPAVLAAFKKVGYTGYCTAEMLPPAAGLVERVSRNMDKILGR